MKIQKKNRKSAHIPIRTCIFCRGKFEKNSLLRFVRMNKTIYFDKHHLLEGRGFYIYLKQECLKRALNKKVFEILSQSENA